uniref:Uncharacterized protein n=1 Tax=Davidia involucrata TaxID=16924 RepID=A0A5B7BE04_DAVIN
MAKHSDLKTPNFSLLNASDSQVLGTSNSLSLHYEPPDIRNWFSSYVYESPELNTGDDFESCGFRGSDCEKEGLNVEVSNKEEEDNLGELRRLGERDELVSDEPVALNRLVNGKNSIGDNKYTSKVLDSSDSLLLSSEPPSIKNWFSSYVYESPALDTSGDFGASDFKESEPVRGGFNVGNSRKEKDEKFRTGKRDELVAGEKIALNGFVKCNGSVDDSKCGHQYVYKGNHGADRNKNSSVLIDLPSRRISEQFLEEKRAQNHDIGSTKDVEKSSFNGEDYTKKLEGKFSREASHRSLDINNSSCNNCEKSPRKLLHSRDSTEESSEAKGQMKDAGILPLGSSLELTVLNGDLMKKQTSRSNVKENDGNILAENGFISTRKSRSRVNDENILKRPLESLRNRVTISSASDKDSISRRKVLSESTNFQPSDTLEIAGKWQCPQKSKPNLGPPLKQLRLEQWVHRV